MPSRSTLIRWGALAAVAAATLYYLGVLSTSLHSPLAPYFSRVQLSALWGMPIRFLVLGGLVGLHARQVGSPGHGLLGTVGFSLAFVGGLLVALLGPLVFSAISGDAPLTLVVMIGTGAVAAAGGLGMLLLGVATLRAVVLPLPWSALPLAIFLLGVPLDALVGTLLPVETAVPILLYLQPLLLGLAWALLGYALWSGMGESTRRSPARAR